MATKTLNIFGVIESSGCSDSCGLKQVSDFLDTVEKGDEVIVNINSPGGFVTEGMAIYTLLAQYDVEVRILGHADSIASVIACAGSTVKISSAASMLIHRVWTLAIGTAEDMKKSKKEMEAMEKQILAIYRSKTGQDNETLDETLKAEDRLFPKDLKSKGFVDEIFEPTKEQKNEANKSALYNNRYVAMTKKNNTLPEDTQSQEAEMPFTESEYNALKATNDGNQVTIGNLNGQIEASNARYAALEVKQKELIAKHEKDMQASTKLVDENKALKEQNNALNATIMEQEVDTFMLTNIAKIVPAETATIKNRLMAFRKDDQFKAMYEAECNMITAKEPMQGLDQPLEDQPDQGRIDNNVKVITMANFNPDNPIDVNLLDSQLHALAAKNKTSFNEEMEKFEGGA